MTKQCDELLPCPFCGDTPELNDYTDRPAAAWVLVHRHKTCPVAPQIQSYGTEQAALTVWNTRAAPRPEAEGVDLREGVANQIVDFYACDGWDAAEVYGLTDSILALIAASRRGDAPPAPSADSGGELRDPARDDPFWTALEAFMFRHGVMAAVEIADVDALRAEALAQPAPQDDFSPFSQEAKIPTAQADGGCSGNEGAA